MRVSIKTKIISASKWIILISLFFPVAFSARGEEQPFTARKAFVDLPISVLDILSRSRRLDMLDYYDVDSLWQAANSFGGPSVLEKVTDNYLKVKLTPVSDLQVCVLPLKKGKGNIVMTLYTIGSGKEAPDTDISFYDTSMNLLETSRYFKAPELKEFFMIPKSSGVKIKELEEAVAFPTILFQADPENPYRMKAKLTVDSYLSQESRKLITPYLGAQPEWEWNGTRWNRLKNP